VSNSTSTARMKKHRVAHYIAVEGSSDRSNRAQGEAPSKALVQILERDILLVKARSENEHFYAEH